MKKILSILAAIGCILNSTGCSTANVAEPELPVDGNSFVYEQAEAVTAFDVLDDGTACVVSGFAPSQVQLFSLDGELTDTIQTELFQIYTVTASKNKLYLTGMAPQGNCVYVYDMETEHQEFIAELTDSTPTGAVYADEKLYLTWLDIEKASDAECPYESLSFSYDGTVLYSFDLNNNSLEEVEIEFPVAITASPQGKLLVYAADENGLYFTEGENSSRHYSDLGKVKAIAAVNEEHDFVFCSDSILHTLNYSAPEENGAYSEIVSEVLTIQNGIKCCGGFTFYINLYSNQKLERIRNSAYVKNSNTIRIISPSYITEDPFGCGYSISSEQLTADEFALSVLSLDSDYDLCLLSSKDEVSANLRDKGTYYALNDIEGIEEYLNRCFPYIKEAATTKDGEIWMLPIAVNIDVIMYNESSCTDLGIDLSSPLTAERFYDHIITAYNSEKSMGYDAHAYLINTDFILQLLRSSNSFDTVEFKETAELIKEKYNYQLSPKCFKMTTNAINNTLTEYSFGDPNSFLFSMRDYSKDQLQYAGGVNMRACAMPCVTADDRSIATCTYLCINPTSEELEAAVDYVESLIKHLNDKNTSMLFSDSNDGSSECLDDLYDIYENASVEFNVSFEIFRSDFERYLRSEISLDEFITEADRKYSAYLNE